MRLLFFFSTLLVLLLPSCHKELVVVVPPPSDTLSTKLRIIWQKPLRPDTSNHTSSPQGVLKGNIVYSIDFAAPTATVEMREGPNGNLKWSFVDFIYPVDAFWCYGEVMSLQDNVAIHAWHRDYYVNAQNGQLIWASDISGINRGGGVLAAAIGEYLYSTHYTGAKPASTSESLARHHYSGGGWDTLVTFTYQGDHYHTNLQMPTLWVNPQGDSVLILRNHDAYSAPPSPPNGRLLRMGVYAFNLRTRTFEWQRPDFDLDGIGTSGDVLIDGNRLYINTSYHLHCIDLLTGQTLWKTKFNDGCLYSTVVMHNDLIIVQGDQRGMWGVHKFTGAIAWYQPETDGDVDELAYFDGVVYCTSTGYGRLYAVQASDGKLLWAEFSPNRNRSRTANASFSYSTVVIDPELRVAYVSDHYYIMCLKLAH